MIDVVKEFEIFYIHIHGFMADNARRGWNAIQNIFFGRIRDLSRERFDAFHWA